jgi:8-oxo-dGTP pyrophosphatase MutT (NUDIX family)
LISPHKLFSVQDFAWRARARLSLDLPADAFHRPMAPDHAHRDHGHDDLAEPPAPKAIPAAVLIALAPRQNGAHLIFIERASAMRAHAGQIAFPGGRMDPGDAGPVATALREAHEEIALPPQAVTPLGFLDPWQTGSGYRIAPLVALVTPPFQLTLCAHEVADCFEAPLSFLMNPDNHQLIELERGGRLRSFYSMAYREALRERNIWGATAGMVRNLYERLYL